MKCLVIVVAGSENMHGIETFRRDRLKMVAVKEDYDKTSLVAMEDLRYVIAY